MSVSPRIQRRRAHPAVLLSLGDFKTLLGQFVFAPEVLFEASSVAVWLPELAIWGRGSTFSEAKEDLLAEIDHLLALLAKDARSLDMRSRLACKWVESVECALHN